MLEHKKIRSLDDYFVDLNGRQSREVYFYRINGYTEKIGDFIKKYYDRDERKRRPPYRRRNQAAGGRGHKNPARIYRQRQR